MALVREFLKAIVRGYSSLIEKTILLIKKVYDKLLEKLMIDCGWHDSLDIIKKIDMKQRECSKSL